MKVKVRTNHVQLGPKDEAELLRRIERLEPRLKGVDPDLVHLEVALEKQARREEYTGHLRLEIMNRVLPARKNRARYLHMLIDRAFDDLEEELDRNAAILGRGPARERKRGTRSARKLVRDERDLQQEIALLDRARAGDRAAFDQAAEARLAGVRKTIFEELTAGGRPTTTDELDRILATALAIAFEQLPRKPERWTLHGWLAWIARREIRDAAPL